MASETALETFLERQRSLLEQQISDIEATQGESAGISFGKRIGEGTSLAVDRLNLLAVHEKLVKQLRDVIRAQAKLVDGTYGRCDDCGNVIEADRIEALPVAAHCRTCATTADRSVEAAPPEPRAPRPPNRSESPWDAVLNTDGDAGNTA